MSTREYDNLDFIATAAFVLEVQDDQPVYVAFNKHALAHSGFALDDILGKTAKDLYPGQGGEVAYARHLEIISSGTGREYELRLPLKSGERLVRTTIIPESDENGTVVRLFGTSVDISHEESDRGIQASVMNLTNEIEDFITMAAHDLRTPMRNVHHIADMLRDDFEDLGDGKLELINLLEDVALKATTLISDVLSHAQATKIREEIVTFDFAELCREICDILDPLECHDISIPEGIITGDKTAYQIVVRNLLDNAFKHGGRERLRLSISVAELDEATLEITVRDDGKGFENPGVAFLESGKMRTDSGFGLLGIRRLVLSRGGTISAETPEIGRGSLIRFSMPGQLCGPEDAKAQLMVANAS